MYAVTSKFQVYVSSDDGFNWSKITNPPIDTAANDDDWVMAGQAGNLFKVLRYPGASADVYRSTDDGETWQLISSSDSILHLVETASGELVAHDSLHIYRSADGGQSWNKVFNNLTNKRIRYLVIGKNGWIRADYGFSELIVSSDAGVNWSILNAPASSPHAFFLNSGSILLAPSKTIYRSIDGGQTYQSFVIDTAATYGSGSFCQNSSGTVFYTNHETGNFFFSTNQGLSWQKVQTRYHVTNLRDVALPDGTIFANRNAALHRSIDGGNTWQFSASGIRASGAGLLFATKDTFFSYIRGRIMRTSNRGLSWEQITHDSMELGRLHGIIQPQGFIASLNERLYHFTEWGNNWNDITPIGSAPVNRLGIHPATKTLLANVPLTFDVLRSEDMGQSWSKVLDDYSFTDIHFHPLGRIFVVVGNSNQSHRSLYLSDNDGVTWEKVAGIDSVYAVRSDESGNLMAVGVNGVFFSIDNGSTWAKRIFPGIVGGFFSVNAQGFWFVGHSDELYMSVNDGINWQILPKVNDLLELESGWHTSSEVFISPDHFLYSSIPEFGLVRSGNSTLTGAFVAGTVRRDSDGECFTPDAQVPLKQWIIKANGEGVHFTNSDSSGGYLMFLDTGAYQISAIPPHLLWWSTCGNDTLVMALDSVGETYVQDFSALALAECPLMSVSVAAPFLRRCFDNTLFVHYCNQGSETADSAWVDVTLDPYMSFVSSAQPYNNLGNNVFRFFLGDVESGECGQFGLVANVDCDSTVLGQTHCVTAHAFPDTLCTVVPNWSGATIEAEVECQDTSVQFHLRNTGNAPSHLLDYIIIEDDVVLMQGQDSYSPGEEKTIQRPANGRTWRIESQQEPGHPFSNVAVAFAEGCGGFESLGFINQFNVNTFQPSWNRFCLENIGAYDPNDKQGFPLGFGSEHRIRPGQELDYMIRFQNTGTDTAFNIVIRDTLSAWLDPASVRPGAASHPYTWELSGQGVLSFTFANILLPDSNTNLAASQGFVTFKMNQEPNVPLQTQIFNSAAIYFDFNPPVITNQTLHTVGVDYISSTNTPTDFGKQNRVVVSPNPVAESAVFQLKEGIFNQHRIIVTDAFGRKIREAEVSGTQYLFQRKGLPPGAYFFRVESAKGRLLDAGKILLK
jgi:uncharacterized repeat protein (TIGR01451 family)